MNTSKPVTGEGNAPRVFQDLLANKATLSELEAAQRNDAHAVETEEQFLMEARKLLTPENFDNMAPARDEPFLPTPFCPTCGRPPKD